MGKRGRIRWISIPFTAGVASGAVLCGNAGPGASWVYVCAAGCFALSAVLCLWYLRQSNIHSVLPMFFLLGLGRYFISVICPVGTPQLHSPFIQRLEEIIRNSGFAHEGTAPLIQALLTGDRSSLEEDTVQAFRASGAAHILALSGLHLGVIYALLRRMLLPLGNSRVSGIVKSIATIACAGFYATATGASPSIVRALIFIIINEVSSHYPGRYRSHLNVLFTSLFLQLAANPRIITSVGFQLSYLAITGIFLIYPSLRNFYPEVTGKGTDPFRRIWNSVALSLSCQLFTAPLVWFRFHTFPIHFLITNLIALPLTECLIVSSVALVLLESSGLCPALLVKAVDLLAECLQTSLRIIEEM